MEPLILQIHKLLINKHKAVAVAESCTGGLLSSILTSVPGSSQYFMLGVIAYSNKSKKEILKIPQKLITKHGAVSTQVAACMAKIVRKIAKTDLGIGITGIAGPTGGSLKKPVGTVFIAIAEKNKTLCRRFNFNGTRASIRKQSTKQALLLLKKCFD